MIVEAVIASLKEVVIAAFKATLLAPLAGVVELTVGAMDSVAVPLPLLHPTARAAMSKAINQAIGWVMFPNLFIVLFLNNYFS